MRVSITYIASSGHKYNLISDGITHTQQRGADWSDQSLDT